VPTALLAASDLSATPVALLIGFGVLVAIVGHLASSRRTVVVGLAILFVATALLMVGGYLAFQDDPADPRPCDAPGGC
jgi:ABC-type siderophore export system fused ATPase/permease subunit